MSTKQAFLSQITFNHEPDVRNPEIMMLAATESNSHMKNAVMKGRQVVRPWSLVRASACSVREHL